VDAKSSVGAHPSIALDSSDIPHISYLDNIAFMGRNTLKYAYREGALWVLEIVDGNYHTGVCSSIAIDTNDIPHISYLDYTNKDLKYAYFG